MRGRRRLTVLVAGLFTVLSALSNLLFKSLTVRVGFSEQSRQLVSRSCSPTQRSALEDRSYQEDFHETKMRTLMFILGAAGIEAAAVVNAFLSSRA